MKDLTVKYNVVAQDANLDEYLLLSGIDEASLRVFLNEYCTEDINPFDTLYRWLKDFELPEYGLPYRANGWLVRFIEASRS